MPDLARLAALARSLLPPGVAVAATDPRQMYPLLPGEALPGAVPARLREFSAGRHAARIALRTLGLPVTPLRHATDRAPVWPPGTVGSITHSRSLCLAAAAQTLGGIGLDLEEDEPLPDDLWPTVLLPEEHLWAQTQPNPGQAAKLIFSAKEAAYKAQYARSRTLFGFDTLRITVQGDRLQATFLVAIGPYPASHTLHGHHIRAQGHILTAFTV